MRKQGVGNRCRDCGGIGVTEPEVLALVTSAFPSEWVGWAVRVSHCESTWRPWAVSEGYDRVYGAYRYVGLFQISEGAPYLWHWLAENVARALRKQVADLFDPETNAHVAAGILRIQGPGAWPFCGR